MAGPAQPPFYVPRLERDLGFWQWSPRPNLELYQTQPAPFSKFWRYDYQIEAPLWLGEPVSSLAVRLPSPPIVLPQSPVYVPRPPLDQNWQWEAPYNVNLNLRVPTPFLNEWSAQYTYVPDAFWLGAPRGSNFNILGGQVPAKQWRYDLTPDPVWTWEPPPSDTLRLLTEAAPFHRQWRYDYVPDTVWQWAPQPTNIETFSTTEPFLNEWVSRYTYVPDAVWTWEPPPALSLILPAPLNAQAPAPQYSPSPPPDQNWQFDPPYNINLTAPIAATPFSKLWRYDLVPSPDWTWEPPPSYPLFALVAGGKPFARQWRWDYVPDSSWVGQPIKVSYALLGGQVPTKQWRYDYVPSPDWQWQAPPSNILRELTSQTPTHRLWRYDYSPEPFWLGQPIPSAIETLSPPATPFTPISWAQYLPAIDTFWMGVPTGMGIVLRPRGRKTYSYISSSYIQ